MRQIISVIGSLAVGLLMAAAGLFYDVQTLAVAGAILFGLAAVLWLYEWGRAAKPAHLPEVAREAPPPILAPETEEHREDQRRHLLILNEMGNTAHNIGVALGASDRHDIDLAMPGLKSTYLTLSKTYDLQVPSVDYSTAERSLRAGAHYLTEIGAYLRQGHLQEARQCAEVLVPKLEEYIAGTRARL